jgi:O-antigen ligase|tara:strand:+ start:143 stop:442 length:300 start_codon:yes stop_codon:yes gene_type:complete
LVKVASLPQEYKQVIAKSPFMPVKLSRAISGGNFLNRMVYWQGAWEISKVKPFTGTGALTFGAIYPYFITKLEGSFRPGYIQKSPSHAHSLYFQILSDH